MSGLFKKIFIGLLTRRINSSNHRKCALLSTQKRMIQRTLVNLHTNKYIHEFQYYPFAVKLDRCVESWNILFDWFM